MEAYSDFASVYDTFMDETPYDVWGDFVAGLIEKYGVSRPYAEGEKPGANGDGIEAEDAGAEDAAEENTEEALNEERNLIVELGCGTGSFTEILAKKGYDIIGTDISSDMLNIARNKAIDIGTAIKTDKVGIGSVIVNGDITVCSSLGIIACTRTHATTEDVSI